MDFVIVTGMSGAGKSRAAEVLEDMGFYCVDNMPPALIPKFAEICFSSQGKIEKVAIVTDIRGGHLFDELLGNLDSLRKAGCDYRILFLDASDASIIKRYKETRRMHPLSKGTDLSITQAIQKERELLGGIRRRSDVIIDTSNLKPAQLKERLVEIFSSEGKNDRGMVINVMSFGFKYGIPLECDLVFDVRFLPNPFYIENLRNKTGLHDNVYDYVMQFEQSQKFRKMLAEMILFLVPNYIEEGKSTLVIGVGCTGGKHRSVTLARCLTEDLKNAGYYVVTNHRDIQKDSALLKAVKIDD
ncbi:MAG: RNase adapter RapZ [Eubacteriales bacterium]|jgi:UPF0042 nucleotide-binding protein